VRRTRKSPISRSATEQFGAAYFRKFYLSSATRVVSAAEMRTRARLIGAILAQASIPVRNILDAGCGIGLLRKPFAEVWPRAVYTGLDASEYLCARYGWTLGSVVDYAARAPSDLVVCYDVLQYLDDRSAGRARTGETIAIAGSPIVPSICGRGSGTGGGCAASSSTWDSACGCARASGPCSGIWSVAAAETACRLRRRLSGARPATQSAACVQSTSALCTLSPTPAPSRASLIRDTTT